MLRIRRRFLLFKERLQLQTPGRPEEISIPGAAALVADHPAKCKDVSRVFWMPGLDSLN